MNSYSAINTYLQCKYKYKLQYIDKLKTVANPKPNDALILGTTVHKTAQENDDAARQYYKSCYNCPMSTEHYVELEKAIIMGNKIKEMLPKEPLLFEKKVTNEQYDAIGFIDCESSNTLYDFKYSNDFTKYIDSTQLTWYNFLNNTKKQQKFLVANKVNIMRNDYSSDMEYIVASLQAAEKSKIYVVSTYYNNNEILKLLNVIKNIQSEVNFEKQPNKLCGWCEYRKYCKTGNTVNLE